MTTEEKIQRIWDLQTICWTTNSTNPTALQEFSNWFTLMIDEDPGLGDWDEPAAEPYLDDAIIWLESFVIKYNLG